MSGKLIAMDLDGTLCNKESWSEKDALFAEPILENIEKSNKLYLSGNHIIIYTARQERLRHATVYWLNKHGVMYHAIVMGNRKMGADIYYDDKSQHL